ncbi:MAG: lysylphosphatidylglycerol synthase domain-containing protein [Anaerolineaceae bacterium]|nr:lysylphosphatidylglycerol synthase domain-containing protein [Anaerolineaceae bacterium]
MRRASCNEAIEKQISGRAFPTLGGVCGKINFHEKKRIHYEIIPKYTDLMLFVPLLYLAILLPLSFNGIGIRESVFVIFAASWGITSADAVAFSLTVFALGLAGSLAGGIIYWFDRSARLDDTKSA